MTEGTNITLTHELNQYVFRVLECRPAKGGVLLVIYLTARVCVHFALLFLILTGILIVNIDLTTDIIEPADSYRHVSKLIIIRSYIVPEGGS